MAVVDQVLTENYAIYNGDSAEAMQSLPSESFGMWIYSPPFAIDGAVIGRDAEGNAIKGAGGGALFNYTSSVRDLSNARTYDEFFKHYEFIVRETHRTLMPGRLALVHCTEVPTAGANIGGYSDFPGDIIRLHQRLGFDYLPRYSIWKEPLGVRNRTMIKSLYHSQIVDDSTLTNCAASDFLLPFRKRGTNPQPVTHPNGLFHYAGETEIPAELLPYRGWKGDQIENRFSHWIWRQYASSHWFDIRLDNVVPFNDAEDDQDEKHPHPLQLDVIERALVLYSNPGDVVGSPFGGVGSEPYQSVVMGRKAWACELKRKYFEQMKRNMSSAVVREDRVSTERTLFDNIEEDQ